MRIIVLIALACLLTACAQQSQVQLYPGAELPSSQELTVQVPAALEVIDINGQEVAAGSLFSGDTRILKLEPGQYRINAFYKNVYDIGGGMSTEVVRTRSAVFPVDGEAGETWRLDFNAPENLEQAREMKDTFTGWSVNVTTGERMAADAGPRAQSALDKLLGSGAATPSAATAVAPLDSTPSTPVVSVARTAPTAPTGAPVQASVGPTASLPHNDATLATLQQLWQLLTPESRKAFLEWAEQ